MPAAKGREERERRETREAEGVHGSASNTFISLLLSIQEQRAHAYSTEHWWGRRGDKRGVKRNRTALQLVGKVLLKKNIYLE